MKCSKLAEQMQQTLRALRSAIPELHDRALELLSGHRLRGRRARGVVWVDSEIRANLHNMTTKGSEFTFAYAANLTGINACLA